MASGKAPRRRRSPEQARREILNATEAFLTERPFSELTVDEVMTRTGLSRPAFYVYFHDRYDLVSRVLERIGAELFEIDRSWLQGSVGDSGATVRKTLESGAAFFASRGPLLQAVADAAANDSEVRRLYRFGLLQQFASAVAARIQQGVSTGEMRPVPDPVGMALALVLMTERYLLDTVARDPEAGTGSAVDALTTVWLRTLYDLE